MAHPNIPFHEVAEIFPLMRGEEFVGLKEDVRTNGLREPIWLYQGKIIDGRNRFRACQETGVEPAFREWSGEGSLVVFVVSLNLHRRHLDESQRSMVAHKLENMRQGERTDLEPSANLHKVSRSDAARLLNVSERSVANAAKVSDGGAPELVAAVESGKVSVSAAATIAEATKEEQAEIVARGNDEILSAANKIRREKKVARQAEKAALKAAIPNDLPKASDRYQLIHSDIANLDIEPESIDWIITDPPYPKEYLGVYSDLSKLAKHALKPGGSLIVMVGQSYLPEVINRLAEDMTYYWTMSYLTPGGQSPSIWTRRVNTFWKPVLWFVKGDYSGDKIGDVVKTPPNDNDKEFHHWGQSVSGMADLVERFTYPGQTILDPFVGGGATGVAALNGNRLFIGADSDESAIKITASRLIEVTNAKQVA